MTLERSFPGAGKLKLKRVSRWGENGVATEKIKFANLVSFTCLKSFAFDQRNERKDAHDLIYCLENMSGGIEAAVEQFRKALDGSHSKTISLALEILRKRFVSDENVEGYKKNGSVSVAKFELGDRDDAEIKEARLLRQRQVADVIEQLLQQLK